MKYIKDIKSFLNETVENQTEENPQKIEIKFQVLSRGNIFGYERLTKSGWEWMCIELNPDNGERWIKGVFNDNTELVRKQLIGVDKKGKEIYLEINL